MKGNIHKKLTFEDKFDRKYACWVQNNRKAWYFWKRKARKDFRRISKLNLQQTCNKLATDLQLNCNIAS